MNEQDIQKIIDNKTKPVGALGQLESLAKQICLVQNTDTPILSRPCILVFAADHGLAYTGVSAYPPEVTAQMVLNFANGGAAINVFTQQNEINLEVIDAGVNFDFNPALPIKHHKIAHGSRNSLEENALSSAQLTQARTLASTLVQEQASMDCNIIGFGEMGIGNTSSAALIYSLLCDVDLESCTGRGTGLDDQSLQRKVNILNQVKEKHAQAKTAEEVLSAVGGLEIACICYAMIEAKKNNMLIMVDGFIASAAALLAARIDARTRDNMIFTHLSDEHAHKSMLEHLDATPLLQLSMRLGEGSACALAYPLIKSAVEFVNKMASFEGAEVSTATN